MSYEKVVFSLRPSTRSVKYLHVLGFAGALMMLGSSNANAAPAHCFADVSCTSSEGGSFTNNTNWNRRTNGKKWRQIFGPHRSECNSLGSNFFNSMNMAQLAADNGACGKVTCSGQSWIGTSRKRGQLGPKSIEVECKDDGGGGNDQTSMPADFQYSSKVVCGNSKDQVVKSGDYKAVVNVHNPNYERVAFRYKFASAQRQEDGEISKFTDSEIGPDGAQYFDCEKFVDMTDNSELLDGFFVIEAREPLDVVTYYTGGRNEAVESLDVERTHEREIEDGRRWSCGDKRENLAQIGQWRLNGGPASLVTTAAGSPIGGFGSYTHDVDMWMADTGNINSGQAEGRFPYRMDFCLCNENEYPTDAAISISKLRADNSVDANVDGNANFITGVSNSHTGAANAGFGTVNVTGVGDHYLELASNNAGSYHAVGVSGVISIRNGYLGQCVD